jgi:hypothetical protein
VTVLLAVQAIVTGVVLAVLLYLVARAPRNVPLRAVTMAILSFSTIVVFGTAATEGNTFLGLEPVESRLVQNLGMIVGGYSLIAFYVVSALELHKARRHLWWQAVPMAIAATIVLGDVIGMPAELRDVAAMRAATEPGTSTADSLSVQLLYFTPSLYTAYAFVTSLVWTRRYARTAEPRLRRGLALTSLGLSALIVGQTVINVATVSHWAGVAVPAMLYGIALFAIVPGSVVFMIGLAYPAVHMRIAAWRIWWQHRRAYHQLTPLWTVLNQRFPEDALSQPRGWRDTLNPLGVHRRYYRRVIECRDGLLRISPFLARTCPDDRSILASQLRDALRAHDSGAEAPQRPVQVATPVGDDLDADVRELITLSAQLRVDH